MKFRTVKGANKSLRIYSPSLGVRIQFKRGTYRTTDRNEIAVLNKNDKVEIAPE